MKQSRLTSFIKSCVSTGVGFAVAFVANMLIMPLFGFHITHSENVLLTTIYTLISIARGYALERLFEALGWRTRMSAFASAVLAERQRQQDAEGWSLSHDDAHVAGELAIAGGAYARRAHIHLTDSGAYQNHARAYCPNEWPWDWQWFKPQGFRRDLVKGCALIIAEGEKFDRSRKAKTVATSNRADQTGVGNEHMIQNQPLAHGKSKSEHAGTSA